MDDKELLAVLKSEMLLAEARAQGAKEAYEWKALYLARRACKFNSGDKIIIKFSDGDVPALFDSVKWSSYEFEDYKGPAIYGWRILKSGAKSKTKHALCTIDVLHKGYVMAANV